MSKIKLIVMGQLTDRYYREAADEYIKRMSRTSPVTEVELKCVKLSDDPPEREIAAALSRAMNRKEPGSCTFSQR